MRPRFVLWSILRGLSRLLRAIEAVHGRINSAGHPHLDGVRRAPDSWADLRLFLWTEWPKHMAYSQAALHPFNPKPQSGEILTAQLGDETEQSFVSAR